MKASCSIMVSTIALSLCACNPNDQSAARENEKTLVETLTKNTRLEQDNSRLMEDVASLTQQLAEAKAAVAKQEGDTTNADLEQKLVSTTAELQKQLAAMDKKIDGVKSALGTSLAQAPRNTYPADGNPPVAATDDAGTARRQPDPPPVREKPKPKYDINFDNPVMGPGAR